ncbi:MAG TPA: hypothetical protein VJA16_20400 [Thermoanaerobaculia bacterium]
MSEQDKKSADIEQTEVEPLTDEDLESVPGGVRSDCSCTETGGNCTSATQ